MNVVILQIHARVCLHEAFKVNPRGVFFENCRGIFLLFDALKGSPRLWPAISPGTCYQL